MQLDDERTVLAARESLRARLRTALTSMSEASKFHIGCQSWGYDDWVTPAVGDTVFYPRGTKKSEMLSIYSRIFDTIEVDATLYGVPLQSTVKMWHDETPRGFTFSLKFPREITHDRLLRGPSLRLTREFITRAEILGDKLAALLFQFPPTFEADENNIAAFIKFTHALPREHRFAVEFRDRTWFTNQIFDALQHAGIALCLVEGKWIARDEMFAAARRVQSDFRYVRVFGERDLPRFDRVYRSRDETIATWADEVNALEADAIYIYSDNYFEGFAPATVNKFRTRLRLPAADFASLESQPSLF